jgi:hypothetical protein
MGQKAGTPIQADGMDFPGAERGGVACELIFDKDESSLTGMT